MKASSGKALFVGLYAIGPSHALTVAEYWKVPAYAELKTFGMRGFTPEDGRKSVLWFDLEVTDFQAQWKGKLVIAWPPPKRSWWRRAHRNDFPILAIHEESALIAAKPKWNEINIAFDQIRLFPSSWRAALSEWRGIYYIFDTHSGKGYVGSAYGSTNILGRWQEYGGTRLLRGRDPRNFRFSILERVSPDMDAEQVIGLEASWKNRLHSRSPFGLNDN